MLKDIMLHLREYMARLYMYLPKAHGCLPKVPTTHWDATRRGALALAVAIQPK